MASAQLDLDAEMKSMVMCFRVSELQVLLGHAGRSKSGRKHELMTRALQLIKSSGCNRSIQAKIVDLYGQRYPHHLSQMKSSQIFSPTKQEGVKKPASPKLSKSHLLSYADPPRVKYQDSPVVFKELPFYEHISTILPPVAMTPKSSNVMHDSSYKFHINSQQAQKIRSGITKDSRHQIKYDIQVQLRICLLDTSCEQNDVLPPNLSVKVNRSTITLPPFIPPTKTGQEPRRVNRPLNITPYCRSFYDDHVLEIKWSSENHKLMHSKQAYGVTINLVQQLNVDDLLRKLNQVAVIPSSTSREVIKQKLSPDLESDISTTSLKVSLLCPLGKMRMKLPTRPLTCQHLQCFDATLFLMMNEKKPTWTCPVCDRPADFSKLAIDGLFVEILNNCDSDEIDFTEDGNWHSAKKKTETLVIGTSMKPIDLSNTASKSETVEKKEEPDIIDLTCDSSDDDEPIYNPTSKSPVRISDGTPMSISSSPAEIGSPYLKLNRSDTSLSSYTSAPLRRSPHHKSSPKPYSSSPVRSPYCRTSESPCFRPRHSTLQSNLLSSSSPDLLARSSPPLKHSLTSHYSRFPRHAALDTPPTVQIPSPSVSSSPGNLGNNFPSLGGFDLDSFPSSLNSLSDPALTLGYPPRVPFDFLSQGPLFNPLFSSSMSPFLVHPSYPTMQSFDLLNRDSQRPGSSSNSRTHSNSQQNYQTDDTNYSNGAIPID